MKCGWIYPIAQHVVLSYTNARLQIHDRSRCLSERKCSSERRAIVLGPTTSSELCDAMCGEQRQGDLFAPRRRRRLFFFPHVYGNARDNNVGIFCSFLGASCRFANCSGIQENHLIAKTKIQLVIVMKYNLSMPIIKTFVQDRLVAKE